MTKNAVLGAEPLPEGDLSNRRVCDSFFSESFNIGSVASLGLPRLTPEQHQNGVAIDVLKWA